MEELTIIVSCYNQEKHLSETIESILAQKADFPIRVIITDDYSLDRCREIIQNYTNNYPNIEAIFAEENGGYLRNILRALEKTKTKYFCLLDADDYWTDRQFLQRAYDFLETHEEYTIYEANVDVLSEDGKNRHLFISPIIRAGTYSQEMLMNSEYVPITQTTGMVLRNCIFSNGVPNIMRDAVGTRSERSFEGDTGRFIMHLKHGKAYYDKRVVGVYRLMGDGIWNSLPRTKKAIISARMQEDYYRYYGSGSGYFTNKAYRNLQWFLTEKQKELESLSGKDEFMDEEERLMAEDVFEFCKAHEDEIDREPDGIKVKAKKIYRILRG